MDAKDLLLLPLVTVAVLFFYVKSLVSSNRFSVL